VRKRRKKGANGARGIVARRVLTPALRVGDPSYSDIYQTKQEYLICDKKIPRLIDCRLRLKNPQKASQSPSQRNLIKWRNALSGGHFKLNIAYLRHIIA
jgi:hypothetical protein